MRWWWWGWWWWREWWWWWRWCAAPECRPPAPAKAPRRCRRPQPSSIELSTSSALSPTSSINIIIIISMFISMITSGVVRLDFPSSVPPSPMDHVSTQTWSGVDWFLMLTQKWSGWHISKVNYAFMHILFAMSILQATNLASTINCPAFVSPGLLQVTVQLVRRGTGRYKVGTEQT